MQNYKPIKANDYMSRSREVMNNNWESVISDFSGNSFPTANLIPRMKCYREDQKKLYRLQEDMKTWTLEVDFSSGKPVVDNAVNSENAQKAIADKNNKDITTYVASVTNDNRTITVVSGDGTLDSFEIPDTTYDVMVGASANKQGGSGLTPAPKAGDNESILFGDGTWKKLKTAMLDIVHPVGSYYWSSKPTNPATLFGGTWEQVKDKFIYAVGKYSVGTTGGSETETLTIAQTPEHTHTRGSMNITGRASFQPNNATLLGAFLASTTGGVGIAGGGSQFYGGATEFDASRSWTGETSSVGGGQPHNNMPPYEVAYCWKRIA